MKLTLRFVKRRWFEAVVGFGCAAATGCGACGTPEDLVIEGTPETGVVVRWTESNAMGLYFVEPDAVLPGGPDDHVMGHAYWVVEATKFPGGFKDPVSYGTLPSDTKDATMEHGGLAGGEPLSCGVPYKVAVVALGGEAETMIEWPCP